MNPRTRRWLLLGIAVAAIVGVLWWWLRWPPTWEGVDRRLRFSYPDVPRLSPDELADQLADDKPPVLLDVRTQEEFDISHLPGARHVSPNAHAADLPEEISPRTPIVAYCSVGYRSAALARRLRRAGFTEVHILDGGLFRWANEGRPLVQGGKPATTAHPYDGYWSALLDPRLHPKEWDPVRSP